MHGIGLAMDALQGALFPPNLVVVAEDRVSNAEIAAYLAHCREVGAGMALWQAHPHGGLGERDVIDVWISDRSPEWALELTMQNLDLPMLLGFLLAEDWGARLRLRMVVRDEADRDRAKRFLLDLLDQARLATLHAAAGASCLWVLDSGLESALA